MLVNDARDATAISAEIVIILPKKRILNAKGRNLAVS